MPGSNNINRVLSKQKLDAETAQITKDCMLELCKLCDIDKKFTRLSDLFTNLSDGVIVFSPDLNILDMNDVAKKFYSEFDSFIFHDNEYKLKNLPVIQAVLGNCQQKSISVSATNQYGQKRNFNIICSPIYSSSTTASGICLVINDVTEVQKQARQLEDMMASFTHDLKTPLIAAETNVQHLLDGHFGDISSEQRTILELLLKSNAGALKLVKNLLNVFKYETDSYKLLLKSIKVKQLINNALEVVKPLIESKNIQISIMLEDEEAKINCDPFELERVLVNLLSNAVKFSKIGANVKIDVRSSISDLICFTVQDEGIGIPADKIRNLFTRFWQSKVNRGSSNGTGLGLYLSRQIVEAHGGTIRAESIENQGTEISFRIPTISFDSPEVLEQETEAGMLIN